MQIAISGRKVGDGCPPYIVAEIGQNHDGDAYKAIRMVAAAVRAGADAVKFQLRNAAEEFPEEVLDAPHPNPQHAFGETYREHRLALDLSAHELRHIQRRIQYNEWPITMFATPCSLSCVAPLADMNMPAFKVASKDLTNLPLVEEVARTDRPVLLSTGMATLSEVSAAFGVASQHTEQIILMACTSSYPTEPDDVHLSYIGQLRREFGCLVGFSDHTVGIKAATVATALGACVIEKHLTLSRASKGTDHAAAVEPRGLELIVRDCREIQRMLRARADGVPDAAHAARVKMCRKVSL